ncbi:MAG: hypothetical protein OXG33_05810 [Chloroflexi bacterium]|nr:hypothetical protein [Chloroflexota bacterium]
MRRRLSVWAYPWDLADEGVAAALDWLRDAGFDAIELCPNYHAISTFAPRNLQRSIHYSEQGAVYFPARAERYGRIEPRVFDEPEVLSAYALAAEHAPSRSIQLNAWVIGMFQPWIARAYPDTAVENVFGARSYATTCPASPDVQEYLAALVGDLCGQYPVHSALLERPGHPDFAYGWVRERILIDFDPWSRFLAGLCFCENCLTAARTHGVDAVEVRANVARELRDRLSRRQDSDNLEATIAARVETDEEFRGYLEAREQSATRLVEGVQRALRGTGTRLNLTHAAAGWGPTGLRLADLLDRIDGLLLPDPTDEADEAMRQAALARSARREIELVVMLWGSDEFDPGGPEFAARLDRIARLPVDRAAVYNFGLLRPETLRQIGGLVRETLAS